MHASGGKGERADSDRERNLSSRTAASIARLGRASSKEEEEGRKGAINRATYQILSRRRGVVVAPSPREH